MRSVAAGILSFASAEEVLGEDFRVDVLQASDEAILMDQLTALIAALTAEAPGVTWTLAFYDLAGAGDGNVFTLTLYWANTLVLQSAGGISVAGLLTLGSQAAQSEALAVHDIESRTGLSDGSYQLRQTDFVGSSSGRRFVHQYLASVLVA